LVPLVVAVHDSVTVGGKVATAPAELALLELFGQAGHSVHDDQRNEHSKEDRDTAARVTHRRTSVVAVFYFDIAGV
jgi:hypothetical protein